MKERKNEFKKLNFINELEKKCEEIYDEKE